MKEQGEAAVFVVEEGVPVRATCTFAMVFVSAPKDERSERMEVICMFVRPDASCVEERAVVGGRVTVATEPPPPPPPEEEELLPPPVLLVVQETETVVTFVDDTVPLPLVTVHV